jgi:protein SPIRAL1 and related proteins
MSRSGHQVSQNVDNFIRDKPSTRLHAPPGGGSSVGSLIYGGGNGESQFAGYERRGSGSGRKGETPEQTNPYSKHAQEQPYQQHQHHQQQPPQQYQQPPPQQAAAGTRQGSSNAYATGSNQNTGNVLTDRRITRIHAPPGGASSFRLG